LILDLQLILALKLISILMLILDLQLILALKLICTEALKWLGEIYAAKHFLKECIILYQKLSFQEYTVH